MKRINQMEPWLGEEEKYAVMKYLESGGWLTEYKKTDEFESIFSEYVGSNYSSAVVNGTMSLVLAFLALEIKPGDEIIVPDYTMIASANAIQLAGGTPILVDINQNNLCIDLNKLEEAINQNTKALLFVSINGRCPRMEAILELVDEHGILLIEDASQSLGSFYDKKHLGTFGKLGTFSFSPAKIITTGQGGMVITNDSELYSKIEMIKDYGRPKSGIDYYEILGYNFKFTDLQAVIGLEQMKKLSWRVNRKKEIYKLYVNELEGINKLEFIETDLHTPVWSVDILVDKKDRSNLIKFLDKSGIGVRPFYPAIHTQPPYIHTRGNFPNSTNISNRGLWLPSSTFLTDEEIKQICHQIKNFF